MRIISIVSVVLVAAAPVSAQSIAPPGATACSGCHGTSPAGAVPPLRGRAPDEIVAAMRAFRNGERQATVMDRIAKGFSDEETRAIAAWFGRQQ
jgi:cytochrome subunit of sulfide dehydrogenase